MKLSKLSILFGLSFSSLTVLAGGPIEPIMVTIPAGSFEMGSTQDKKSQPIKKVKLNEFSIGKYEVTVREFSRFIDATGQKVPDKCYHEFSHNGWFRGSTEGTWRTNALNTSEFQPVVCINWELADAYVKWLAKETGKPYRLPSEAEWEYAARAGIKEDYYFGSDNDRTQVCEYENTADLTGENILQRDGNTSYVNWSDGISNCADGSGYASIVGMYKPNPFGVHDMLSNVLEFLADCYEEDLSNTPLDGTPLISNQCERYSTRGSSWHWSHWPVTKRGGISKGFSGGVDGFRIALDGSAPVLSKQSQHFLAELKREQQQEQARRDLLNVYPDPVQNLTLKQEDNAVALSWSHPEPDKVESYRVYRNVSKNKKFTLLASNLIRPYFKDAMKDDHQYEYVVAAVYKHQQSQYSNPVATPVPVVKIPGQIEAEYTAELSGAMLSYRQEDKNLSFTLTGRGGISEQGVFSYYIEVPKTGSYQLQYRVASPRDTKGVEVLVNNSIKATDAFKATGGYNEWQTQTGSRIQLKKGKHTLTLNSKDKNWKLNWLALK